MAKRAKKRTTDRQTPKEIRRYTKSQEEQRKVLVGALAVVVATVAILAIGFYQEIIAAARSPVAVVNGKEISTRDYQKMVQYQRFSLATSVGLQANQQALISYLRDQLPQFVLDDMIDQVFIDQKAAEAGITVTDDEVQAAIEERFDFATNQSDTALSETTSIVTDTESAEARPEERSQDAFSAYLEGLERQTGLSESEFREIIRDELLQDKVQELIGADVPAVESQVHARHVLVETEEEAQQVRQRLLDGEDFATVAQEVSTDPSAETNSGDLGWFSKGKMVPEFEEVAFGLPVGEISEPVQSQFGFHIIEVLEIDENRALEPAELESARATAFNQWRQEQRASADMRRLWSLEAVPDLPEALANLQSALPPQPIPTHTPAP